MGMRTNVEKRIASRLTRLLKIGHISPSVPVGSDFRLPHGLVGVFVNQHTTIGDRVTVYQGAVIGRYDANQTTYSDSRFERVVVESDVIIYANAVIVGGPGVTTIGRGSIIGAGAVVTGSTGPGEVWAGNPAKMVKQRDGWPEIRSVRTAAD